MSGQHTSAYPPPTIPRNEGEVTRKFSLVLAVLHETADRAVNDANEASRRIESDNVQRARRRRKGP
jgi:hypothetical protein